MQLQQRLVMRPNSPPQGFNEFRSPSLGVTVGQIGEFLRVCLPGDDRTQDGTPTLPQPIREDAAEFQVGIFQRLFNPRGAICMNMIGSC